MKFIFNFILILIFTSCSNIKPINHQGVEVFDIDQFSKPQINENENKDIYGPTFEQDIDSKQEKRDPVIGVIFAPSLSSSYRYIGFLKALDESDIKINLIFSTGFSSSFISSYALYRSVSKVEWLIFNRFGTEEEKLKIYSKEWQKKWKVAIAKHFENIKIEQTKIPIFIPYFKKETSELIYSNREKLSLSIERQLKFEGPEINGVMAFMNPYKKLKSMGADIVIFVDALGDNFSINNEELRKVYEKVKLKKINQYNEDMIVVDLSEVNEQLEDEVNHNLMIKEGYDKSQLFIQELIKRIEDWKK